MERLRVGHIYRRRYSKKGKFSEPFIILAAAYSEYVEYDYKFLSDGWTEEEERLGFTHGSFYSNTNLEVIEDTFYSTPVGQEIMKLLYGDRVKKFKRIKDEARSR